MSYCHSWEVIKRSGTTEGYTNRYMERKQGHGIECSLLHYKPVRVVI